MKEPRLKNFFERMPMEQLNWAVNMRWINQAGLHIVNVGTIILYDLDAQAGDFSRIGLGL